MRFFRGLSLASLFVASLVMALPETPVPNRCAGAIQKAAYPHSHPLHTPTGFIKVKDQGPQILWSGDTKAPKPTEFKLMSYNVENLITHAGRYPGENGTGSFVQEAHPKSPEKRRGTAKIILQEKPHVIVMPEVFRISDARDFCNQDLKGEYEPLLIEGNDERGIDVAMLVRKDMPYEVHYHSNKDVTGTYLGRPAKTFSRDMPVAYFVDPKTGNVDFAVVGVHNKSKRGQDPSIRTPDPDPESSMKRETQAEAIAKKTKEIKAAYPDMPVFVAGDFNNDVPNSPEFAPLKANGLLVDSFDQMNVPREQRITHSFHPRESNTPVYTQLDAVLTTMPGQIKDMRVIPYTDEQGHPLGMPQTYQEREKRPSDHRAIMATFKLP